MTLAHVTAEVKVPFPKRFKSLRYSSEVFSKPFSMHHSPEKWPYLTNEVPPVALSFKQNVEDFVVEEVPAYAPQGEGEHLFIHFEKIGLNTHEAVQTLAKYLEVDAAAAGVAGLKDKYARTTQWVSLQIPVSLRASAREKALGFVTPELRVMGAEYHANKLRTGHLRGNRFRIVLRDASPEAHAQVERVLEILAVRGVPDYFGAQRFGREGRNWVNAKRWLIDQDLPTPRDRKQRKWLVSVLQSYVFNVILAQRINDNLFDRALVGDVMCKTETGGMFVSEDAQAEQARMDSWEISPTGPIIGVKMREAAAVQLQREHTALRTLNIDPEALPIQRAWGPGTRRPLRIPLKHWTLEAKGNTLELHFELPKGAYATAVIRELMKSDTEPH